MPLFDYIAMEKSGGPPKKGRIKAPTKTEAHEELDKQGLAPLSIELYKEPIAVEDIMARFQAIKPDVLVYFTRQLATMLDSGMMPVQSLNALAEQEENAKFKEIIEDISRQINTGSSMADAFAEHPATFDRLYVAMLRAGEESGELPRSLGSLAFQLERAATLRKAVKSATIYPKIVLGAAFLILSVLLLTIVPTFANLFEEIVASTYNPNSGEPPPSTDLPVLTQIVVGASHALYPEGDKTLAWWGQVALRFFVLFIAIMAARKLIRYTLRQEGPRRRWDQFKLNAPMGFGKLIQKISVARFARTYSSLLASGITAAEALDIVADTAGNVLISEAVMNAKAQVMAGATINETLGRSGVFPPTVIKMIEVGEETGKMEEMLSKIADFFEEEVDLQIKGLTSLIEPLMILFVGGAVGVIIIAVYLPLFGIYDKIGTTAMISSLFASLPVF